MKKKLTNSQKERFAEARRLYEAGDLAGELKIRKALANSNPENSILRATLGKTLWDTGNLIGAERELRVATGLAPRAEGLSLGLFHVLWDQDLQVEAVKEADRFLSVAHSKEYSALLKKLKAQSGHK
ncbi:MAG: hypothetical protein IID51_07640 [Proteobacteria bacterium]|nr:hypothetical protein [Pseudomonadota bacterium]